jgi:predicted outer membrane repeat protein
MISTRHAFVIRRGLEGFMVGKRNIVLACVVAGFVGLLAVGTRAAGVIIYVDVTSAAGAICGADWANACTNLQSALANATSGDTVRVAAGAYKPTGGTDRNVSFELKPGVTIEGGYPAGGGERNPGAFKTILSGDIGIGDDNSDNSYRVVTSTLSVNDGLGNVANYSASIDGVTITAGNANGWAEQKPSTGGGMYVEGGQLSLVNVTFSDNFAQSGGGGLATYRGSPTLTGVTFSGNRAGGNGGGIRFDGYQLKLTNVTFVGNSTEQQGGAVSFEDGSYGTLTNVTMSGNSAWVSGGGFYNNDDSDEIGVSVRNAILWDNTPDQFAQGKGKLEILDSVVKNGCPTADGFAVTCTNVLTADPKIGQLADNGGATPTVALLAGSSAINAGVDYGVTTDQRGVARPQGAGVDIGAFEYVDINPPTLTVPGDKTAEAADSNGAVVAIGQATAVDDTDPAPVVTNNAPAIFQLGTTNVTWTATDATGNSTTKTQVVTVVDTTAPSITAPVAVTATATSAAGIPATSVALGTPTVSDLVDANPLVANNAPAIFPVGVTTVTWTATDHSSTPGNSATATQLVTVIASTPPPPPPTPTSRVHVRGEGTIVVNGAKAKFEFSVQTKKDGKAVGNLSFEDKRIRLDMESTRITSVVVTGTHARIEGTTRLGRDHRQYTFVAEVDDLGGRNQHRDQFAIQISNGFTVAPTALQQGRIEISTKAGDDRD